MLGCVGVVDVRVCGDVWEGMYGCGCVGVGGFGDVSGVCVGA